MAQKQSKKKRNGKTIQGRKVNEKVRSIDEKPIEKTKSIKNNVKADKTDIGKDQDQDQDQDQEQLVCKECGVKIPKDEAEEFDGMCEECAGENDESYEEYPVEMWGD